MSEKLGQTPLGRNGRTEPAWWEERKAAAWKKFQAMPMPRRNDDGGYSFVYKQPESPDEQKLAKEAMEGCPVEAIGSNGA